MFENLKFIFYTILAGLLILLGLFSYYSYLDSKGKALREKNFYSREKLLSCVGKKKYKKIFKEIKKKKKSFRPEEDSTRDVNINEPFSYDLEEWEE